MQKIVIKNSESQDLLKCITLYEPQLNYNMLNKALRKKDIKINGKRTGENLKLNGGEIIEIFLPDAKEKEVEVVYQDERILIANKPSRMEVTLKDKVFDKSKCLEEYFSPFKAVHRLDKNTNGLVILAKNDDSYKELLTGFKQSAIIKKYYALIWGKPKQESANLTDYLVKGDKEVKIFKSNQPNSDKIKTNYKLIKTNGNTSILEIDLLTGKTHQIRAHLAFYGMQIVGDDKYGDFKSNKQNKVHGQCLCAYSLGFSFSESSFLSYLNKKTFKIKPEFDLI